MLKLVPVYVFNVVVDADVEDVDVEVTLLEPMLV